jgi:hypothetical protein
MNPRTEHGSASAAAAALSDDPAAAAANDNIDAQPFKLSEELFPLFFPRWARADTAEAKLYHGLHAEIEAVVQPEDILDAMDVIEVTNTFWESQRIRNCLNEVVKAARVDALAVVLAPVCAHHYDRAVELAGDYFSGDPDKRRAVISLLCAHGMGQDVITAQAIAQRAPVLDMLNRTAAKLGIHREAILSAVTQRREMRLRKRSSRRKHARAD